MLGTTAWMARCGRALKQLRRTLPMVGAIAASVGTWGMGGNLLQVVLAALLGAAVVTDLQRLAIPNALVAAAAPVGVALRLGRGMPVDAGVLPALVALGALLAVRAASRYLFGRVGLGMGDVKLGAVLGLFLGWPVFWVLYLAFLSGGICGLTGLVTGRFHRDTRLPFAPFIALGTIVAALIPYPL